MPLWLALFPLAAILIVTHSRGPLLGCVAALGVVTVRRKVGLFAGLAAVAMLLMTGVALVNHGETTRTILNSAQASHNPVARLLLRGQTAEEFASFTDRDEVWSLAEDLILDRPVAGYGYQGSRSYLLAVVPWAAYAHNALLQTALDLGIIGTLLLWLPLVRSAFTGSLSDPYQDDDVVATRGATLAFVLFLLVSSFSSESFAAAPGFQTLLVVVCVLAAERTRQEVRDARRARPMVAFDRVVLVGAR
jgi:O-antigen ligase